MLLKNSDSKIVEFVARTQFLYGKRVKKLRNWGKKGEGGDSTFALNVLFTFLGPFSFSFDPFSNCLAILLGSLLRTWIFLERNSSPCLQFSFSENFSLKGVFAKNERGYRLNAIKKALLIATNLTSICCVYKEKIHKDVSNRNRSAHTNWGSWNIWLRP